MSNRFMFSESTSVPTRLPRPVCLSKSRLLMTSAGPFGTAKFGYVCSKHSQPHYTSPHLTSNTYTDHLCNRPSTQCVGCVSRMYFIKPLNHLPKRTFTYITLYGPKSGTQMLNANICRYRPAKHYKVTLKHAHIICVEVDVNGGHVGHFYFNIHEAFCLFCGDWNGRETKNER